MRAWADRGCMYAQKGVLCKNRRNICILTEYVDKKYYHLAESLMVSLVVVTPRDVKSSHLVK